MEDDRDMKIVGDDWELEAPEERDLTSDLLEKHSLNGNLDKAKCLGGLLAGWIAAAEEDIQLKILLTFAAEMGLRKALPVDLVKQTGSAAFYDTLESAEPVLYRELQESGAFSFYYLCVREETETAVRVGEIYASLCKAEHADNAKARASAGTRLYIVFTDKVVHTAKDMGFIWD